MTDLDLVACERDHLKEQVGQLKTSNKNWHARVRALKADVEAREELMEVLENIQWVSIDKDNMEFSAKITCFQMDKIRKLVFEA